MTLVNRGPNAVAARRTAWPAFTPLAASRTAGFAIVVKATPVGRDGSEMPFDIDALGDDAIVVDLSYGPIRLP